MSDIVTPLQLKQWLHDGRELALFDVREHGEYGAAHLFHAVSLPYSRLEREAPRLAPNPAVRTVVYDEDGGELARRAAKRLRELGYTRVHLLAGGSRGWRQAEQPLFAGVHVPSKAFGELVEQLRGTPHIGADALATWQREGRPVAVLDGRPLEEFRKMNIPGGICCPNGELGYRIRDLVKDAETPIVVNCAGRTRSIIGAQTLLDLELENPVYALENGTQGWVLAGLELEHGTSRRYPDSHAAEHDAQRSRAAWKLAERAGVERVTAARVADWAEESERSLFLCDVRSAEEFSAGSLPGARHTPGGQLIQATDSYIGVRGARVVLFDGEGIRAPIAAAWLRQMGHEVHVLMGETSASGGLSSGLTLPTGFAPPNFPALAEIDAVELREALERDEVALWDLRSSADFLTGHVPGSRWTIRPRIAADLAAEVRVPVLLADDEALARLALWELPEAQRRQARLLRGGIDAWRAAGGEVRRDREALTDAQRIDFLFFTHDRHAGNKAAARQYLEWEIGLLDQMDSRDLERMRASMIEPSPRRF